MTLMKPGLDYVGITTPFFCHDGKGKFLFHRRTGKSRDESGTWESGSGKLEFGLTPDENVLKEIEEEYGCKGKIDEQLPAHSIIREKDGNKIHWLAVPFIVKVNPKVAKNNEPEKSDMIGWFSLKQLPEPLHTGFKYTFEHYKKYFKKYS